MSSGVKDRKAFSTLDRPTVRATEMRAVYWRGLDLFRVKATFSSTYSLSKPLPLPPFIAMAFGYWSSLNIRRFSVGWKATVVVVGALLDMKGRFALRRGAPDVFHFYVQIPAQHNFAPVEDKRSRKIRTPRMDVVGRACNNTSKNEGETPMNGCNSMHCSLLLSVALRVVLARFHVSCVSHFDPSCSPTSQSSSTTKDLFS